MSQKDLHNSIIDSFIAWNQNIPTPIYPEEDSPCRLCEKPATGMCKKCSKFYCDDHNTHSMHLGEKN